MGALYWLLRMKLIAELLPAEAGRLEEIVSYGLKSFAHDLVIRKLSPLSSGSTIDFPNFVIHTKWYFRS
jgi:hypothetical protein